MTRLILKKTNKKVNVGLDYKFWFLDLLNNISISTTKYIIDNVPNVKFSLIKQDVLDSCVLRKIGFFVGDQMICQATNRVERNDFVNKWIEENPNEPFGTVFLGRKLDRILVSKTKDSRKYRVKGDINAEIEEKFYLLPKKS